MRGSDPRAVRCISEPPLHAGRHFLTGKLGKFTAAVFQDRPIRVRPNFVNAGIFATCTVASAALLHICAANQIIRGSLPLTARAIAVRVMLVPTAADSAGSAGHHGALNTLIDRDLDIGGLHAEILDGALSQTLDRAASIVSEVFECLNTICDCQQSGIVIVSVAQCVACCIESAGDLGIERLIVLWGILGRRHRCDSRLFRGSLCATFEPGFAVAVGHAFPARRPRSNPRSCAVLDPATERRERNVSEFRSLAQGTYAIQRRCIIQTLPLKRGSTPTLMAIG